jgi:hypothetical protein
MGWDRAAKYVSRAGLILSGLVILLIAVTWPGGLISG